MKTVVTGGAGFIGSNLVKDLSAQNRSVSIVDDLSRGNIQNLTSLGLRPSELEINTVDLRDFQQALKVTRGTETVFHLAARIGGIDYLHGDNNKELEAFQANMLIDTNVFRACLKNDVRNLVYASSVGAYPTTQPCYGYFRPLSELDCNHHYCNPDGGYGWSKLVGEIQLVWLDHVNVGVARIFNVYGVNSDLVNSPPVIAAFMLRTLRGQDIMVWGDGSQTRDFIHVSDCVAGLLCIEKHLSEAGITVNIGSGRAVSIETIARKVAKLAGGDTEIVYEPARLVGPVSQVADLSKAKAILDWAPVVRLEQGLEDTYNWLKGV